MMKYSRFFFAVLLAHTLRSNWILRPVSGTALDINKDSKVEGRLVVGHFDSDREGYKTYTYQMTDSQYVNVTSVYFGDRLLKVDDNNNMKCDYVHYIKVYWLGDVAPFLVKFKYYSWRWVSYRLYFKLTAEYKWVKATVLTIDDTTEEGYKKLFKQKMDNFVLEVGSDKLEAYKPFLSTKEEVKAGPAPEEAEADKKKYVLMVVVVVVFVVVASLVVFLVKFCLK